MRIPQLPFVTFALAVLLLFQPAVKAQELAYCEFELALSNEVRHVYGNVAAECTSACPPFAHSFPFGNWGVDSNVTIRQDGYQFSGWATSNPFCGETMNTPEWNSCTSWPSTPDCTYFNYSGCTEQYSPTKYVIGAETRFLETDNYVGCEAFDGWDLGMVNVHMNLYELDSVGGDEHITDLQFPDLYVTLSCPDSLHCTAVESAAVSSSSNGVASAKARLRVEGWYSAAGPQ